MRSCIKLSVLIVIGKPNAEGREGRVQKRLKGLVDDGLLWFLRLAASPKGCREINQRSIVKSWNFCFEMNKIQNTLSCLFSSALYKWKAKYINVNLVYNKGKEKITLRGKVSNEALLGLIENTAFSFTHLCAASQTSKLCKLKEEKVQFEFCNKDKVENDLR